MPYQTNYDEASSHSSIEGPFESAEENIMYNKLMRVMETGSPQDMDFTEYQNIIKELYPDVSICTQKKMNSYIKAVRKAHAFYSGNLGKGEELRNVIVDDRGHVAQVITKRANYEEEIAKAKEFAQDQEMFGTDLSGNDSDRYTLSGLFDTFKNGVKHYGSKAFGASFMSTILGYACGLAKKLIWSAASYIWNKYVTERVKDAMYAMAVVLILIVCHCMNLGNCVAGLLQTVLLIVARGDSILRVALSSVAMAYVARDALAGWQQIRPVTNVYTNVERPVEKEKKLRVLKGKFQGNTLKDQVFEGNGTLFTSLMKIFCCLIAVCTMDKLPSTATFMGLLRKCKEVPQAFKGVLEMGKLIEGAFDSAFGACFENCFGVGTMKANPIPSEVLDCTTRIIELTKLSNLARVSKESALCAEADALYQQYSKFRVDYSGNREVVNHLNMCAGNARDLFAQARSTSPKANEARTRPPAVIFTGQSGTGKSVVMNYIVAGILVKEGLIKKDMTDEEIELRKGECVYPRMPEQEYWDGYYGQTITIYDDFAQMRDSVVRPNVEFFELIRTTNMFPCPLHMAELSQKANTYFSSKYIFMTSNANQLEIESLICPQAVQTRFAYWVRVELDERIVRKEAGVLSGTIDNEKVLQLYGTYNTPEIYRFKVQDGVNEETTLNIRELIDLIYSKRQLNERGFASLQTGVGDFARGMFQAWPSFSEKAKEFMVRPDYEKTYEWTKQKIAGALAALRERVENTRKWCLNIDPLKTITIVVGVAIMCYCNQEHFAKWSKAEGIGWLGSNSGWTLECVDLAGLHKYVKKNVVGVSNAKLTEEELCNWDFEEIADTLEESDKGMIRVVFQGKEEVEVVFFFHGVEQGKMVVAEATRLSLDDKIKMAVKMFTESGRSKQQAASKVKLESGRSKTVIPKVVVESELESGTSKQFVVKHQVEACGESGTSKRLQIPKAQLEILRPNKEDSARLEQWASRNAQENVVGPVRNAYWQLRDFESRESLAPVVAIGGRCYMINTHYWDFIKRKERIVLSPWGSETGIEMMTKELDSTPYMLGGEETDLTLILLPSYTPINLALWKRFHTSQDAAKLDQQVAVMVSPAAGIDNGPLERCTGKFMSMYTEPMDLEKQDGSVRTLKAHCYVFDSRSYCGDCGGLYVIDDNNFEGKIIAFHFGGAASGGALAVPLIRQHFEFLANAQEIVLPKFVVQDEEGEAPVVGAVYQGYVREPPGMNMKTSIVKSMLHGHVQETTVAPAQLGYILKPDGPGLRGLKKVCGDVPHVDPEKLYYAAESWKVLAFSGKYPREWRKKLTFEEAVAGVPGREYIKPINRSTSAGYPWCLVKKPGTKGKQGWLGFADWDLSQPGALELRAEVERLDALLKQGVLEPSVFNDTLKDETRPIEKVQAGKTRVFAAAPMCGVVLVRQYFGRFVDAITSNRIHNEVCVGIQAHSTDWTHLASRLRGVGDNVVAGDFSDYDGSLNPAILKKIFQLVNEWYADEYSQERMLLAENLCHSYHVAGPRVYRWTHSQPSGNPLTAILNSIYNSLVTRIAWMYLAEERGFAEFYPGAAFNQHVRMASYGDDNLISVSSEVKDWFNMERLVAGFARAGMKYTSEAKDGQVYTTKSLVNCSFLKRGFRKWRSWWLAPLQQDSINEALNWCHKNANTRNNMEEVARTQVAEWALHDTEKFEEMRDKIQMAVFKVMGRYIESIDQERYIQTMLFADYGTLFPLLCYS